MFTKQETFEKVCRHLHKQNRQALGDDGVCAMRGNDSLRCAAGCLIDDEDYNPMWDTENQPTLAKIHAQCPSLSKHDLGLVVDLQRIHDRSTDGSWNIWIRSLRDIAISLNLSTAFMSTLGEPGQ